LIHWVIHYQNYDIQTTYQVNLCCSYRFTNDDVNSQHINNSLGCYRHNFSR